MKAWWKHLPPPFQKTLGVRMSEAPKIRIMNVITALPTGGAEIFLCKLLAATAGSCDSVVVSLSDEGKVGPRIVELGVPLYALRLRRLAPNPFKVLALRSLVRAFRPQLIQGWMYHGNLLASLAGVFSTHEVHVFWNIQQSLYDMQNERWLTARMIRLGARWSRSVATIIYNSRVSAGQHEEHGFCPARRIVIPSGFDCRIFHPDEEARRRLRAEL